MDLGETLALLLATPLILEYNIEVSKETQVDHEKETSIGK